MSENASKSARPKRATIEVAAEKQPAVVAKSPRKQATPAKKTAASPVKKSFVKKVETLTPEVKGFTTLQRENAALLLVNKELRDKVDSLQEQVTELGRTIKSMKHAKTTGTVKGFPTVSPTSEEEPLAHKSARKPKSVTSTSPKKSARGHPIVNAPIAEFLPSLTPWKTVLKEHFVKGLMAVKQKLEFRDAMQSFLEDNLGRSKEIKCRFIDAEGHVDIGIPENLVEKFVDHFNKKMNAPKLTRSEELAAIVKNNSVLPKRRLTITADESPAKKKKNVKVVSA
jgi:hypothetical protein